jgi:hypothetical protein
MRRVGLLAILAVIALSGLLASARPALADELIPPPDAPTAPAPGDPHAPASPPGTPDRPRRWFVLPVVSYLPETGLGGGAVAGLHAPVEGTARPASFFATALYTTEGQGLLDLAAEVPFARGALVAARGRAVSSPDRFYGIGPDTPSSARERFTHRWLDLAASAELPLFGVPYLRAGPRIELRAEEIDDVDPGGALARDEVAGAGGSSGAAGGLGATWDTRDGAFWPTRGSMIQAWYVEAPAALSRTGAYGRGVIELRQFAPLGHGVVLGVDAYGEAATGAAPFTILPRLGSTRMLRGIREGRYRDRVGWAFQSELRAPLWRRISGVAFGAVGDVAPRIRSVTLRDPKLAGGVGLRYRLTDEGANVRVDLAASRFGVQVYLLVLEAF